MKGWPGDYLQVSVCVAPQQPVQALGVPCIGAQVNRGLGKLGGSHITVASNGLCVNELLQTIQLQDTTETEETLEFIYCSPAV